MPGITLVRVHEPDAVREIIEQATTIVDEWRGPPDLAEVAFSKAVDLLAARIPLMQQPTLDLAGLNLGPRL